MREVETVRKVKTLRGREREREQRENERETTPVSIETETGERIKRHACGARSHARTHTDIYG